MSWRRRVWINEQGEMVTNRRPWGLLLLFVGFMLAVVLKGR